MDDFSADLLAGGNDRYQHDSPPSSPTPKPRLPPRPKKDANEQANDSPEKPQTTPSRSTKGGSDGGGGGGGFRSGLAALREKASIQDRLVEKMLQQVMPADDGGGFATGDAPILTDERAPSFAQRPNFNLTTMSNNFRRFNARIGVVFKFQARAVRVLSWRRPSHTLSLLAVYTFVCLDPYLVTALPLAALLLGVLVPAFLARHPAPPQGFLSSEQSVGYSPRGPPLAPAATVRPVKELSKDFFRNMRDLQNTMDDFSVAHDKVVSLVVPLTNFGDEAVSSAVFQALFVGGLVMTLVAQLLPWRLVFLVVGWAAIVSGHPAVARVLHATHEEHVQPREADARSWIDGWVARDVMLDSAPETREVEVFELQRLSSAGGRDWEPWLFSPSPYDPLSQARIAGHRPRGTRFFEDVVAPEGWEWSEKKWALDLWSREWVEERIITGVEVETEGERWVYDIYDDVAARTGVVELDAGVEAEDGERPASQRRNGASLPSWEEGEDSAAERRGDWRRRRWVRLVKRRVASSAAGAAA